MEIGKKTKDDAGQDLSKRKHLISLQRSNELITNFKKNRSSLLNVNLKEIDERVGILPTCETFNAEVIKEVLKQPDCVGLRIYMGLNDHYEVVFVLRGVDALGKDILNKRTEKNRSLSSDTQIVSFLMDSSDDSNEGGFNLDDAQRVPPWNDPDSE